MQALLAARRMKEAAVTSHFVRSLLSEGPALADLPADAGTSDGGVAPGAVSGAAADGAALLLRAAEMSA